MLSRRFMKITVLQRLGSIWNATTVCTTELCELQYYSRLSRCFILIDLFMVTGQGKEPSTGVALSAYLCCCCLTVLLAPRRVSSPITIENRRLRLSEALRGPSPLQYHRASASSRENRTKHTARRLLDERLLETASHMRAISSFSCFNEAMPYVHDVWTMASSAMISCLYGILYV